ncbi:hypothetical protein [Oceanobacillus rekensis]|uniref:hypothetical protein n=1 Tax=Oceanobacillus rekensis TaxID=937927 RepID=UPI000B42FE01|nr:hypothetical protein [Oceanobacillus rekensis]
MDWIFDNLFIIIIIVSGLIGFFRNNDSEEKKKETTKPVPPKSVRIPNTPPIRREQPRAERKVYKERPTKPTVSTASIEEQQKVQMERLAGKNGAITDSLENLTGQNSLGNSLNEQTENSAMKKESLRKQVTSNLGAQGLVNGIIMSEVLGAPRAKKPFKTVLQGRIR